MICQVCKADKHPGLFPKAERAKPAHWAKRCMKCAHDSRPDKSTIPTGAKWRYGNAIIFCKNLS
jgi:hypothetical protein